MIIVPPPFMEPTPRRSRGVGDRSSISGDPLSREQKEQLLKFVSERAFAALDEWRAKAPDSEWRTAKGKDDSFRNILLVPLSPANAAAFSEFVRVLKDPQAAALGISNKREKAAAQVYLKAALKLYFFSETIPTAEKMREVYEEKITGSKRSKVATTALSAKYRMIFGADPVKANDNPTTSVDILLSRTYFMSGEGEDREATRERIRRTFLEFSTDPATKHIVDALALSILTGKGRIFIGDKDDSVGDMGFVYYPDSEVRALIGGFCNSHSLFLPAFRTDAEGRKINWAVFLHESLHFLFNDLLENNFSPVLDSSIWVQVLDVSLLLDKSERKGRVAKGTLETMLDDELEKSSIYFPGGFDLTNQRHLHTMRVESIVRIMQAHFLGESLEDIGIAAPRLYGFYICYAEPMLKHHALAQRAKLESRMPARKELQSLWNYLKVIVFFANKSALDVLDKIEKRHRHDGPSYERCFEELTDYFKKEGMHSTDDLIIDPAVYMKLQEKLRLSRDKSLVACWPRILCELKKHGIPTRKCESAQEIRDYLSKVPRLLCKVTHLDLSGLGLINLPPEINLFSQLKSLDVRSNKLQSTHCLEIATLEHVATDRGVLSDGAMGGPFYDVGFLHLARESSASKTCCRPSRGKEKTSHLTRDFEKRGARIARQPYQARATHAHFKKNHR